MDDVKRSGRSIIAGVGVSIGKFGVEARIDGLERVLESGHFAPSSCRWHDKYDPFRSSSSNPGRPFESWLETGLVA